MVGKATHRRFAGFTLVELLVVIGIIALLISILFPTLAVVRERAQRTVCASRLRQLGQAVHMYANESKGRIPAGTRDGDQGEHCIWISSPTYDALCLYLGTRRNTPAYLTALNAGRAEEAEAQVEQLLACPNLYQNEGARTLPFKAEWGIGWVIGYNYLGRHLTKPYPSGWVSPQKINEKADLPLFCDLNDWSPGEPAGWTIMGHRRRGATGFFYPVGGPKKPTLLEGVGGNYCALDGSVVWKPLSDMIDHDTIPPWGKGTNSFGAYRGMW